MSLQCDGECLIRHGHNKLLVSHEAVSLGRLQVHGDEQVVVAAADRARQVRVLDSVEELRLVHMAAEGVGHTVVSQSAHRAIQLERVVVKLQQVGTLRKLQDINTPTSVKRCRQSPQCIRRVQVLTSQ